MLPPRCIHPGEVSIKESACAVPNSNALNTARGLTDEPGSYASVTARLRILCADTPVLLFGL